MMYICDIYDVYDIHDIYDIYDINNIYVICMSSYSIIFTDIAGFWSATARHEANHTYQRACSTGTKPGTLWPATARHDLVCYCQARSQARFGLLLPGTAWQAAIYVCIYSII